MDYRKKSFQIFWVGGIGIFAGSVENFYDIQVVAAEQLACYEWVSKSYGYFEVMRGGYL